MLSLRCFAVLLSAFPHIYSAEDTAASCSSDQGDDAAGRCSGPEKPTLQWRLSVYNSTPPGTGFYGDSVVLNSFGSWFKGPVEHDDWDLLWTYRPEVKALRSMTLSQRPGRLVNHCGYFRGAGQKCILTRHISRVIGAVEPDSPRSGCRKLGFSHTYDIHDSSEMQAWLEHVERDPDRPWIVKACSAGGSQGVELVQGRDVLATGGSKWKGQWMVAQEYIDRPFLGFGGRKFHLRLYLLVTQWWPSTTAFLYNEGLLLRSRHSYKHESQSTERDIFSFVSDDVEGLTLGPFWDALDSRNASTSAEVRARLTSMFSSLFGNALSESFGSAENLDRSDFRCFDIFGADVMIDENLQPILLEMNMSPNLSTEEHGAKDVSTQSKIKGPLLRQVAHWAALHTRQGVPKTSEEALKMYESTLVDFTRLL